MLLDYLIRRNVGMATLIRPELSTKNKYYIDKHRYYELKHFCLQYPVWRDAYISVEKSGTGSSGFGCGHRSNTPSDPTGERAMIRLYYREKMKLIEKAAKEADDYLYEYIIKAVTEDLSFTYLKTKLEIPCGRDMYYDRYRKFFWLLNKFRG
jgi:hypothetical protein